MKNLGFICRPVGVLAVGDGDALAGAQAAGDTLAAAEADGDALAELEAEHRALVHPDGSECPDGCGGGL